jgi:hypothetical protein
MRRREELLVSEAAAAAEEHRKQIAAVRASERHAMEEALRNLEARHDAVNIPPKP